MHADRETGLFFQSSPSFPAPWSKVLPRSTVDAAETLAETLYTSQPEKPDGIQLPTQPPAGGDGAKNAERTAPHTAARADAPAVFPPRGQVFRALELTPPENVRAVILGQDPYPTAGHACGLCFSVNPDTRPLPPSLRNIFKEYAACFHCPPPSTGDLTAWAERGVLLLNAVLTVEEGRPGSHRRRGWQAVTDAVLRACLTLPCPTVFLLWGRDAQTVFDRAADCLSVERKPFRFSDTHYNNTRSSLSEADAAATLPPFPAETAGEGKFVLRSSHPSPLGAGKPCGDSPPFLESRPFLRANLLLGENAIDWRLP